MSNEALEGSLVRIDCDPDADAMYISFREPRGSVTSRRLDDVRAVDVDDDGAVGVELLFVSHGVNLDGLPRRDEISAALRRIPRPV